MSNHADDRKSSPDLTQLFRFPSPPPEAANLPPAADGPRGDLTDLLNQQRNALAMVGREGRDMATTPGIEGAARDTAYRAQLIATYRMQQAAAWNIAAHHYLHGAKWGAIGRLAFLGAAYLFRGRL